MKQCSTCNGTGTMDIEDPCPDCMGSGLEIPDAPTEKDSGIKPTLKLLGEDGNAFAILGKASRVARENKMDWEKIKTEAMSGDYDHVLQTMMEYFDVE